jgi:hypothetical protein
MPGASSIHAMLKKTTIPVAQEQQKLYILHPNRPTQRGYESGPTNTNLGDANWTAEAIILGKSYTHQVGAYQAPHILVGYWAWPLFTFFLFYLVFCFCFFLFSFFFCFLFCFLFFFVYFLFLFKIEKVQNWKVQNCKNV